MLDSIVILFLNTLLDNSKLNNYYPLEIVGNDDLIEGDKNEYD